MGYRYLLPHEIEYIHLDLQHDHADISREIELNSDMLESAAYLPKQSFYRGFFMKAAALFRSLVKNHAFGDGNKRVGFAAMVIFLERNGYHFEADNSDAVEFTVAVADSRIVDLQEIAAWIREHAISIR